MASRSQLLRQAPLLFGILIGWLLLWLLGSAMVLSEDFHGYGWPGYVINAWSAYHRVDAGYDAFRQPMHGWLLGALGELLTSYPHAAIILSSLSAAAMVLSAGLIAGQLGGAWAGGLAAATLPMVSHNAHAARAANHYPLQGGLAGLAVATAILSARRPRSGASGPVLAILSGLLSGLAVAVDSRMLFFVLIAGVCIILSGRLLRIIGFLSLLWVGPQLGERLVLSEQPMMSASHTLALQRPVLLRWASQSNDPALVAACADASPNELPSLAGLRTPCAQAMWRYNRDRIFPRHVPFGLPLTAAAALLALLPLGLRHRRRDGLLAAAWVIGAGGPLLLQSLWVPQPDRYLVPWAVFLATLVPLGLSRLPLGRWLAPLAILCAGLWAWKADPSDRTAPERHAINDNYRDRRAARWAAVERIGESPFLDCSGLYISVSLLPRVTSPQPPMLKVDPRRCAAWIAQPPSPSSWMATDPRSKTYDAALLAAGWSSDDAGGHLVLWRSP